jgi:hypothetical protein
MARRTVSTALPLTFALSPLVHLRIARRRVANTWRESEHLLALTVLGAIFLMLIVPIAVIVWRAVS